MVQEVITYRRADMKDIPAIQNLLKENHLPYEDIQSSNVKCIVATEDGKIIGCIGIEKREGEGLLRSFAVADSHKNKQIGRMLLDYLLEEVRGEGIHKLHLLTTTAKEYFSKKGFIVSARSDAPASIAATREFSHICPSNSTYMTLLLHS